MFLVSVILTAHNKGKFLKEAIDSVLNQSWNEIELIIIDDNSIDNTSDIINQLHDERIKYYRVTFNNASKARNFGISKAVGKYIQFLDGDDFLDINKIEYQLKDGNNDPGTLLVTSTYYFYDGHSEMYELDTEFLRYSSNPYKFIFNLYTAIGHGMVQPGAWLVSRQLINTSGFWNESLTVDDDGEYFCRVILNSKKIIHTDIPLNFYRRYKLKNISLSSLKSESAFESMLKSAFLKISHLEKYYNDHNLSVLKNSLLVEIMVNSFPKYKHISNTASLNMNKEMKIEIPQIGGYMIEQFKKYCGWKLAKYLQFYKGSILKNKQ